MRSPRLFLGLTGILPAPPEVTGGIGRWKDISETGMNISHSILISFIIQMIISPIKPENSMQSLVSCPRSIRMIMARKSPKPTIP